jgi:hypothetical protein
MRKSRAHPKTAKQAKIAKEERNAADRELHERCDCIFCEA